MDLALAWRLAKWGGVVLALVAIWMHGHHYGVESTTQRYEYARAQDARYAAEALAESERKAREKEQGWADYINMTVENLENENDATDRKLAAALARLRSGGLRLPTCPAAPGVSEGAADSPGDTQAAAGELPRPADQPLGDFLLTEAARADDVAHQLAACQAVLKSIR